MGAWRRFALALGVLALAFGMALSPAQAKYASLVMDADSGRVLHQINAETRNYPASLTKMMTLYLVFEALSSGQWKPETALEVSARASRQPPSKLALKAGQTITVRQAILALVTKSANDVAVVVAEGLAGSERNFALKMTAKARALGMARTTFRNASGLYNRGQLSTAHDMAILAQALLRDFPGYYDYFSTERFTYKNATYRNHNKLLETYDGVDGIKTGYIRASGYNLVASAKRDGRRLIGVVFGGRSSSSRNSHMAKLLDKGFRLIAEAPVVAGTDDAKAGTIDSWAVQVGAFGTRTPALEVARKAIGMVPDLLATGSVKVVPLKRRNGRDLYRARVMGLSKQQAQGACRILERRDQDCLVIRMKGVRVARNDG